MNYSYKEITGIEILKHLVLMRVEFIWVSSLFPTICYRELITMQYCFKDDFRPLLSDLLMRHLGGNITDMQHQSGNLYDERKIRNFSLRILEIKQ